MPGRPYILAETNWQTVEQTPYEVAILPWGATEAHNYHLPYSTDVVQCDEIVAAAARIAWEQDAKVIVLPTVPFGVNTGQFDIKLDLNLNPSTQLAVLQDLVEVLAHQGIPKLLIVNGHGGNDFKQMVRELLPRFAMFICCMDWFRIADQELFAAGGDHANEMETSLMQYLRPDWVCPCRRRAAATSTSLRSPRCGKAGFGPSAIGRRRPTTQASATRAKPPRKRAAAVWNKWPPNSPDFWSNWPLLT